MPGAGGQDRDVTGGNLQFPSLVAAEAHARMSAGDAEHLVHGRMIMQEVVNAVPPHVAPAIGAEQSFDRLFWMAAIEIDRTLVDQNGIGLFGTRPSSGKWMVAGLISALA